MKDFTLNTIVGTFGVLRLLLPTLLTAKSPELCVVYKIIEIYEICLHLLGDTNHTTINASLECLCVILSHSNAQLANFLINDKLIHMQVLRKRRSLKNHIFRRKSSAETPASKSKRSEEKLNKSSVTRELENSESDASNVLEYVVAHDEKGLLTGSDIELDSLRLNDFELCQSSESLVQLSETNSPVTKVAHDLQSLKSHKSTDSLGSFFNTLIHPNTGNDRPWAIIRWLANL